MTTGQVLASQTTVCGDLIADHREVERYLDKLEAELREVYESGLITPERLASIDDLLQRLTLDMAIHFACEERGLFPLLQNHHPMVLMEMDHENLVLLRDKLEAGIADIRTGTDAYTQTCEIGFQFIEELRKHIDREDNGIFPLAERDMTDEEKREANSRMQTLRDRHRAHPVKAILRAPKTCRSFQLVSGQPVSDGARKGIRIEKLLTEERLQIRQVDMKAGEGLSTHWSPMEHVLFCLSGRATFEENGRTEPLEAGKGLVISPRLMHSLKADTDCSLLLVGVDRSIRIEPV